MTTVHDDDDDGEDGSIKMTVIAGLYSPTRHCTCEFS